MARRKSINDIRDQAARIERNLLAAGYGGASRRFQFVEGTYTRYSQNIAKKYGGELGKEATSMIPTGIKRFPVGHTWVMP